MGVDFDVVVVGFGPTGATLAALLGQAGVRTLVVDRAREVYDRPRAFALDHEIMRVFQNLGIARAVLPHTAPFTPSEYYGVDGQLIKRLGSIDPPYPLGWPPNLVFNQPAIEKILRERVASFPSVEVKLGVSLESFSLPEVKISGERILASCLVGCDGAASTVRQQLGIEYEDLEFDEPWLVVDLVVGDSGLAKLPQVSVQYCEPSRPCTYLIGPGAHRRWEIMLLPGEDPARMEKEVWTLLSRWLSPEDARLWRVASYRFHALVAREWRRGNVFLAGDAAHQQPPFTGQGMCQGIRDAANLAWKLTRQNESLLRSYEVERKTHVRRLTSTIKEIGRLICERDPAAARARDMRLLAEAGGDVRTVPRQSLIPPLEAGFLSPIPHPANGTLFPQPRMADGRLLDDVAGTGFRVFRKEFFNNTQGAAWFERNGAIAALVRPDHYVYGVARDEADLERQKALMEKALQ
ncbi:MAG: bifunctional 3-(3-hydroxy-phenyl)propionate/3-hydroxycinnamic acid hydroxylase [Betaproteobacteria bacterium]|nr:bifunctional 3-(3-hydroxy-phenyl)propionate/3-hydroxycinnamic acid hydroxylase [Betaproteobacteria bacterium]